jgi:hypothetical protein
VVTFKQAPRAGGWERAIPRTGAREGLQEGWAPRQVWLPRRPGNQTGEGTNALAPLEATPGVRGGRPSSTVARAHARSRSAPHRRRATRVPHPGAQRWPAGRSWGAPKPAPGLAFLAKNQGVERERERERSVSDADASTYRAHSGRSDSRYVCSHRTHAKTTPHHAVRPSPLLIDPLQSASTSTQRIKPNPTYLVRQPTVGMP